MRFASALSRPAARPVSGGVFASAGTPHFRRGGDEDSRRGCRNQQRGGQRSRSYRGEAQSSLREDRPRRPFPSGNLKNGLSLEAGSPPRLAPAEPPRCPDDTPLRLDNRDQLLGLLTERAAKTLLFYFTELNPTLMQWLEYFMQENPIPREGSWDDVSGENFLRKLLGMPVAQTRWDFYGRDKMYSWSSPLGVDPRNIAQRIMEIRSQIAKEWVEELKLVTEENAILMRETVVTSFALANSPVEDPSQAASSTHPELLHPDFDES